MLRIPRRRLNPAWYVLLLLLSLPVIVPTLTQPIEDRSTDIAAYHVYRSIVFSDALDNGWLYPRWASVLNSGLGSPLFSFYSPGSYYAADALRRLGLSHLLAWRALLALAVVAAAIGSCALVMALSRRPGLSVLAATTYIYAPALLRDTWQRGSPQGLAFALLPWTMLTLHWVARKPSGMTVAAASVLTGALIMIHNLSAILMVPLFVVFVLFLVIRHGSSAAGPLGIACALGVLLATIHTGPFLMERDSIQLSRASDFDWAKPADQQLGIPDLGLWPVLLDTGIPNVNGMNLAQVDLFQAVLLLAATAYIPATFARQRASWRFLLVSALGLSALVIFLQLDWATPIWRLPALGVVQFRWRLLSLLAPALLLVLTALGDVTRSLDSARPWVALSFAIVVLSVPRLYPELLPVVQQVERTTTLADITDLTFGRGGHDLSTGEFETIWRQWDYSEEEMKWAHLTPIANLPEGAQWLTDERTPRSRRTRFTSPAAFEASLHLLYFPGWQVTVDGVPWEPYPSEGGGYLTVPVPAGEHEIVATYGGTRVQHVSAAVSGLAALACVVLAITWRNRAGEIHEEPIAQAAPRWEVLGAIALLVAVKLLWIDPQTTWFRHASTREAIYGATEQVDVSFDGSILLHGLRIDQWSFEPGDEVQVTLYWSADGFPDEQYPGSFVHLLGNEPNEERSDYLWGQSDTRHIPGRWEQGELFADAHNLTVDPEAPEGSYMLEIGWWWPETGTLFQAEIRDGPSSLRVAEPGYLILSGLEVVAPQQ